MHIIFLDIFLYLKSFIIPMEQYWIPKELDFDNLRLCIDNYDADRLFIRDCGGYETDGHYRVHGKRKVDEGLEGKALDFKKDDSDLYMLIDSEEVFHFTLDDHYKGFSLAYERYEDMGDYKRMVMLSHGVDPYDTKLPYPEKSLLRNIFNDHLIEIYFKSMVNLKFHSWYEKPHFKYWIIDMPDSEAEKEYKKKLAIKEKAETIMRKYMEYAEEDN